ncbi:MAG: CopG family ribbon-helix-helix protein [Acidobacteriota bacterium]
MRETITISLPEELKRELDSVVAKEGVTRSDLVRESLRSLLAIRRFRQLRLKLTAKAKAQGIYTDRDVFDRVS